MSLKLTAAEILAAIALIGGSSEPSIKPEPKPEPTIISRYQKEFKVTVTAYTLSADETDDTPTIAAWGDHLKPTDKVVALSRDLEKLGLKHRSKVYVPGYGKATVLDRMNKRWKMKVDILLPTKKEAFAWGKQQKTMYVLKY